MAGLSTSREKKGMISITWTQLASAIGALIVIIGAFAYHVDRRFDDLRREIDHRFDDLHRYLEVRFKAVEERIDGVEHPVSKG